LGQVYDSLLGVGLSERIDLADYMQALCARLPELQGDPQRGIRITCNTTPILLGLDEVTALGMAVAELVGNSYRHAFPNRDGTITVTLQHTDVGRAAITIRDDGIGFVAQSDTTRRGISLVVRLLEGIGGTLGVDATNGTSWTLDFVVPLPADGTRAAA
jgi:two-component sensor histidine kinase